MSHTSPVGGLDAAGLLLTLAREARHAESPDALRFVVVNRTRRLLAYRQAVLLRRHGRRLRMDAVSNVPVIDRTAPFAVWLERVAATIETSEGGHAGSVSRPPRIVAAEDIPEDLRADWADFALPDVLWLPLCIPGREPLGVLWLARDGAWSDGERLLATELADAYAHALEVIDLRAGRRQRQTSDRPLWRRVLPWAAVVAALIALALPVPQTALAPAEVAARNPLVVAAPLDGVITTFHVRPNEPVEAEAPLFSFEDEPLRAERDVAAKSLAVAEAEYRKAAQSAFRDPTSKADLAILEATVELRRAELAHAQEQLSRVTVRAAEAGIAVFGEVNDWLGRPVRIGERVLELADPEDVELHADLAVADAIALSPGTKVRAFLSVDPLAPIDARLTHASYEARMTPEGVLAYKVRAAFAADRRPRIGLKGTAKLYGEEVPLALYLFRRPLAAVRQWLGV